MGSKESLPKARYIATLEAVSQLWRYAGERKNYAIVKKREADRARAHGHSQQWLGYVTAWAEAEARISTLYDTLDTLYGHPVTNTNGA